MFTKLSIAIKNFYKYIKRGGVTYLTLSQVNYGNILSGKKILITGGSSGIGFAIAKKCIAEGAYVLITGQNKEKLTKASLDINSNRLFTHSWDVSNLNILTTQFKQAINKLGGIDILVNNAAFVQNMSYNKVNLDFYNKTMDTNLRSIYFLSRETCDYFIRFNNHGGKIVNISSINGLSGDVHPYSLSKCGLNCLTEGLAKEYAAHKIIINGIAPGICDSSINKCNASENAFYGGNRINRIITPTDIAELALFLMSDASNAIIGQTIVCDGGQTLKDN